MAVKGERLSLRFQMERAEKLQKQMEIKENLLKQQKKVIEYRDKEIEKLSAELEAANLVLNALCARIGDRFLLQKDEISKAVPYLVDVKETGYEMVKSTILKNEEKPSENGDESGNKVLSINRGN